MENDDYLEYIDPGHPIRNTDSEEGGYCHYVETHLYLYSYWWILIIVQIMAPIIATVTVALMTNACEDFCGLKEDISPRLGLSVDNILTLTLQLSLWAWAAYLVSTHFCQTQEPMLITATVFLVLLYLMNLAQLCTNTEDKAVINKASVENFREYVQRATNMAPSVLIEGSSYHYETVPATSNRSRTRQENVTSYEGSEVFHYDKWLDLTDLSCLDLVPGPSFMTIVSFRFESLPGDEYTRHELETFEMNFKNYVSDLDAHTRKFRRKTQIFEGCDPESFREVFVKRRKIKDAVKNDDEDDDDGNDDDDTFTFSVMNPDIKEPWYCSRTVLIITTLLAIRNKIKSS